MRSILSAHTPCRYREIRVTVFDADTHAVISVLGGNWGRGQGQLMHPRALCITANGQFVAVADMRADRVTIMDAQSGSFVTNLDTAAPMTIVECQEGFVVGSAATVSLLRSHSQCTC